MCLRKRSSKSCWKKTFSWWERPDDKDSRQHGRHNKTFAPRARQSGKILQNHGGRSRPHGGLRKPDQSGLLRQGCHGERGDCKGSVREVGGG